MLILKQFVGSENVVSIPRALILWVGDLTAALVLNQVLYWQATDEDWVPVPYGLWRDQFGLSEYVIRKAAKRLKEMGVGFQTGLRKYDGAPTVHYHVDWSTFEAAYTQYVQNGFLRNFRMESEETQESMVSEETPETSIDQSKRSKIKSKADATASARTETTRRRKPASPTKPIFPAAVINPYKDRLVSLFSWSWDTMTGPEKGQVQKAAYEFCQIQLPLDRLDHLHQYCVMHFDQFGPMALVTNKSNADHWQPAPTPTLEPVPFTPPDDDDEIEFPEIIVDHTGTYIGHPNDNHDA